MIDIIDVKNMCKNGKWKSYVKDNNIYLKNECGEVVKIGEVITNKEECKCDCKSNKIDEINKGLNKTKINKDNKDTIKRISKYALIFRI